MQAYQKKKLQYSGILGTVIEIKIKSHSNLRKQQLKIYAIDVQA